MDSILPKRHSYARAENKTATDILSMSLILAANGLPWKVVTSLSAMSPEKATSEIAQTQYQSIWIAHH